MDSNTRQLINDTVLKMIEHTSSDKKIKDSFKTHDKKIHFIPKKYRVFGGLLQSLNIQFGNFIEMLMRALIENDGRYEILTKYSGKKSSKFKISTSNEARIDAYITRCQTEDLNLMTEFPKLLDEIVNDKDTTFNNLKHDIDLLFKDKQTGIIYYTEIKYNDDHDTGKFVDINRKLIKTYAYLINELTITEADKLVPILFFFTNKRLKGNIYLPEETNIRRGEAFFRQFLSVKYNDVDDYMKNLSESDEIITMFNNFYHKVMNYEVK